ncbi:RNA polymerase sigma factor [Listeria innocua]|uniref:RNA polymerase sigma factor n=1 Tax=Listeria innocua TaxID=1642 RepID=UPI001627D818|nr:hypothetical protein [Listeria innocua]MBC1925523.1 hypothetical protein [Listeria innocua]
MKIVSEQEIEQLFDSFCKKVLKNKAHDIFKAEKREMENQVSIEYLLERQLEGSDLFSLPDYTIEAHSFPLVTINVVVSLDNEDLADALWLLKEENREILLLYYFLSMKDEEIGQRLSKTRQAIQKRRTCALSNLRDILLKRVRYEE